ncbi:MAG: hydantoinase B/oxoprolinase family protein [Abditibacteriales bacterium]|nr:hydantoinase B/oxoprolinase family protein [Abditibacteriales bacterium]MDW8366710.1 hydantoinase B/oxoprolinase family protein [Abditibacteriales bacterium]
MVLIRRVSGFDPAELTLFSNLLVSLTEEMGVTLTRTAYSPNIKERRDFSCALFDGQGRLIAQGAHMPVHLGSMPASVAKAIETFQFEEGDVVILNDPYLGGTHLPDITLVTPIFVPSDLRSSPFAFLATRAHHADVGGMTPGSMPLSRELFQEGLVLPPMKLYKRGEPNEELLALIRANVRTPWERMGDLRAQLTAHEVGKRRLIEVLDKYGATSVSERFQMLLNYSERMMRAVITQIPDGVYAFADCLDDDGINDQPIFIRVRLSVRGSQATVDFTGSDPECAGSLNAVAAITQSATYYCFMCLLGDDVPFNAGCYAPIRVVAPAGTVVNARFPRAVAGGNVETSQRIVDVVLGALAQAVPERIPAASQGTMNNLTLGGYDGQRGRYFAYYETIAGGMGARPTKGGIDGVHTHMTNTMNTPIEALEFAYPLRVERYELRDRSGGEGKYRGGCGIRRDVRVLCNAQGAILSERRRFAPYGLHGGQPGSKGENVLIREGKSYRLPGKTALDLQAGDVISLRTPGGGGWGAGDQRAVAGHPHARKSRMTSGETKS